MNLRLGEPVGRVGSTPYGIKGGGTDLNYLYRVKFLAGSTPYGIKGGGTREAHGYVSAMGLGSTPYGIKGGGTVHLHYGCQNKTPGSTPYGIKGGGTLCPLHGDYRIFRDQRLTASKVEAQVKPKRTKFQELLGSTPYGIKGGGTKIRLMHESELATVINALRHQRLRHYFPMFLLIG